MSRSYLKVNSVTHAMKAKNILSANGIYAQVVRNGNADKREGCGYSVLIDGDADRAVLLLRANHVKILGHGDVHGRL